MLLQRLSHPSSVAGAWWPRSFNKGRIKELKGFIEKQIDSLVEKLHFVSLEIERFYFGNAVIYRETGLLSKGLGDEKDLALDAERLAVIDLTTIGERQTRLLTVDALLSMEWTRARTLWATALGKEPEDDDRVPTFIVVDEAHNLIPFEARTRADEALRERFRTIAAEGRKYGLYLILVSQRPDKLDALVLSECENKAIMRLGTPSVLQKTIEMLGLESMDDQKLATELSG